jgi:Zn-dependent protease
MFLLVVAFIFAVQWRYAPSLTHDEMGTALVTSMVLLLSVVAHEIGHLFAMVNLGGGVKQIVLTPWGGNSEIELPPNPWAQLIVTAAGPFVNLAIFMFTAAFLMQINQGSFGDIINVFQPHSFDATAGAVSLFKIAAWVNFYLLAINLIPCFPFDGAQLVRSGLELLRLDVSKLRSECAIMVLGNGVAIGIVGLSFFLLEFDHGPVRPLWFFVMATGITLYFAARYSFEVQTNKTRSSYKTQDWEFSNLASDAAFYGVAGDYHSGMDDPDGEDMISQSQWMTEKQEARQRALVEQEFQEDRRADEILEKLHMGGMGIEGLNADERDVLNRVSDRLRRRRLAEQEIYGDI